jgi:DNA-binding transcriptional ArsR family regulator
VVFVLELDVADLAATRFTVSPLHQTVISFFPMYICSGHAHTRWVRDVRGRADIDHQLLAGLVSPDRWIPDFVTPAPTQPRPSFAEQLDQIRETPLETVVADVHAVFANSPLPSAIRRFDNDPAALLDAIVAALAQYWAAAIAPYWPRISATLEADVLYRGLQSVQAGPGAALGRLDPRIHWRDGLLTVDIAADLSERVPVAGRITHLLPNVFVESPTVQITDDAPPWLGYRSRRSALTLNKVTPIAPSAIRELLGRRRAGLLLALDQPRSTTELAYESAVTPSGISQHLRVLAAAGLVDRARVGRHVMYSQTELARQLFNGAGSASGNEGIDAPDLLGDLTA